MTPASCSTGSKRRYASFRKRTHLLFYCYSELESHTSVHKSLYFNLTCMSDKKKKDFLFFTSLPLLVGRFRCGLCCFVPSQWHWCWVAVLMRTLISPTHSHTDTQSRAAISLTHSDRHTRWTPHACAAHTHFCKQTQTRLRFHKQKLYLPSSFLSSF